VEVLLSSALEFLTSTQLARICEQKFGTSDERCLLYPTKRTADHCRAFLVNQSSQSGSPLSVRLVQYLICPEGKQERKANASGCSCGPTPLPSSFAELHIVLFPTGALPLAKECWQHTGMGISSRYAEHCLSLIPEESAQPSPLIVSHPTKGYDEHYFDNCVCRNFSPSPLTSPAEYLSKDQCDYLGERYGYTAVAGSAAAAKRALRHRIASTLARNIPEDIRSAHRGAEQAVDIEPKSRGAKDVTEDDVFLFPTGMCAIWNAYELVTMTRPAAKSICFGYVFNSIASGECCRNRYLNRFSYLDTLKLLQKWGPGCHFFGHGLDTDINELQRVLEQEKKSYPCKPPALALFTEFPSNPLLRAADLPRLRALADQYDFLIIIDETVGNFLNVSVLSHADIVVSSTSKIFSGGANVTGGRSVSVAKSSDLVRS
jgi:cystathionine gamma-synthase